jgi:hypothetical protein
VYIFALTGTKGRGEIGTGRGENKDGKEQIWPPVLLGIFPWHFPLRITGGEN